MSAIKAKTVINWSWGARDKNLDHESEFLLELDSLLQMQISSQYSGPRVRGCTGIRARKLYFLRACSYRKLSLIRTVMSCLLSSNDTVHVDAFFDPTSDSRASWEHLSLRLYSWLFHINKVLRTPTVNTLSTCLHAHMDALVYSTTQMSRPILP